MIPPIADRFVAGESAADALDHVQQLNRRGVGGLVNLLGEHYADPGHAAEDRDAYLELVRRIGRRDLDACVTVKPSQLGLDVGEETFRENLLDVVSLAAPRNVFVWVDMEDHTTTDPTLDAYEELARRFDGGVGVAIQSNLRRTRDDLARLAEVPGAVRLVKGAYDEPADIAYRSRDRIDEAFRTDMEFAFREFETGTVAVGSHDEAMIQRALELAARHPTDYEFQMLMGVRDDRQGELAREGHPVSQYVPYGGKWLSYFYRRIRERKANLLFAARAVLGSASRRNV
jgi:proline dehydrogenase